MSHHCYSQCRCGCPWVLLGPVLGVFSSLFGWDKMIWHCGFTMKVCWIVLVIGSLIPHAPAFLQSQHGHVLSSTRPFLSSISYTRRYLSVVSVDHVQSSILNDQMKLNLPSGSSFAIIRLNNEHDDANNMPNKQPILYLPGIDGVGNYTAVSYSHLCQNYDCWRLQLDAADRSSFLTLAKTILDAIRMFPKPPILIGESFGGLLATYLASRYPKDIASIVLVNPATSVRNTPWRSIAPLIASTGPLYPAVGISSLLATALDSKQIIGIGRNIVNKLSSQPKADDLKDTIIKELKPLISLPDALPAGETWIIHICMYMFTYCVFSSVDTLSFRMKEWLETGSYLIQDEKYISSIDIPVLLLIGIEDRMLPSKQEGRRLKRLLLSKNQEARVVRLREFKSGHALLDRTFNLLKEIDDFQELIKLKQKNAYASLLPSKEDLEEVNRLLKVLSKAVGPVFFRLDYLIRRI
jgi:pimeloyl-ACP methyl ester carboxylesterase